MKTKSFQLGYFSTWTTQLVTDFIRPIESNHFLKVVIIITKSNEPTLNDKF